MRSLRLSTSSLLVVVALSACTDAGPPEGREGTVPAASSPAASAQGQWTEAFTGEFVSQAATTRGRVTLTVTPSKVELKLDSFSTGAGGNLYVHLNPGKLQPDAAGEKGLSSTRTFVVAPLKSRRGAQSYDLTPMWKGLPEVQSVTIYQYSARARRAYGTANLVRRY